MSEDPPRSVALEGASGKTGKGQLQNRGAEVTFHSVVEGVQAVELIGRCGHMLFWLGFLCSESIWVNSWEKSEDFKQTYAVFGSQSPSVLRCRQLEEYPGKAPLYPALFVCPFQVSASKPCSCYFFHSGVG